MTERIKERAEYIKEHDIYEAPVAVEYDAADENLPEAKRIAKRLCEYMSRQKVGLWGRCRFTGQFRFDGSVESDLFQRFGHKGFADACERFYCKHKENLSVFEWQHATADFNYVIHNGIDGYRKRIAKAKIAHAENEEKIIFLEALEQVADGVITWAHRCADACLEASKGEGEARAAELLRMHETLYHVPEFPARNFYEAIQSLYIVFDMLPDSIGTIDRYLWEYYQADIDRGAMTRDEAKEYLQELFLRLQSATPFESGNRKKGGQSHFAIGGYLPDGSDGFTDLSYLIVEAMCELPSHIPQVSLRYTQKTPIEVLRFMMDTERHDPYKRIALVNDDPRVKSFMERLGMSWEDAISYTMVGCNEPAFPGGVWMGGITANIARSLTNTLYDRAEEALTCRDFDSFYRLYEHALTADMEEIFRYLEFYNRLRARDLNVLSSLFMDGCIENAESATRGGCRIRVGGPELMGLVTVIDSLSIIKQFVFEEKRISMQVLLDALRADWVGYEELQTEILKKGRFFGNGDELSDGMAQRFCESLSRICKDRRLEKDISVLCGNLAGYHPHYTTYGKTTLATPDGRRAGEAFMVGIGQAGGKDREGLTALLSSVARFDPYGVFCGPTVTNVMLDEAMIKNDANFEKVVKIVDAYFKMGGLHIQLNYVSKETLLDAKAHPEKYGMLKVRVSGFSGVFVELQDAIQENVIERTAVGR